MVVFNEALAKLAEQYLKKGMKVYVEGALQTRKWQDQSGMDRYTTEVVLQKFRGEIQMLDKLPSNRPPGAESPDDYGSFRSRETDDRRAIEERTRQAQFSRGGGAVGGGSRELDDEIPF